MDTPGPEPLTDAALDREIAAALNVAPSPAFVARVRQRIAEEPVPGKWHISWAFVTATGLAVAIIATLVFRLEQSGRHDPGRQPASFIESRSFAGMSELQADRSGGRVPLHSGPFASSSAGRSVESGFSRTLSGDRRTFSGARTEPEILIDIREANALRALFAGASLGVVDVTPLASAAAKAASELTPPPEIVIAPLVNEPLTPVPGEGARP
jgi:hypothetical protein